MTRIKRLTIFVLLFPVSCLLLAVFVNARYLKYKQTDPLDIVTRDKIDRDIDAWIEKLNRQVQADTVLLTPGTSQVVQLLNKYTDTDYQIFLEVRVERGPADPVALDIRYSATPTTDSSFTITKATDNVNTLQWMAIRK